MAMKLTGRFDKESFTQCMATIADISLWFGWQVGHREVYSDEFCFLRD